jgi:hypothetical protein
VLEDNALEYSDIPKTTEKSKAAKENAVNKVTANKVTE